MTKNTTEVDKRVGAEIRKRRMLAGLSQGTLGEKIGVTFQQVQKYEKGANRISASRMQQMADVLRCSVSDFFGASLPPDAQPVPVELYTSEGVKLLSAFGRIPSPDVRSSVRKLIEALADREAA